MSLLLTRDEIISKIDLNKVNWVNRYSTNCYAYALGLDVPQYEIGDYVYAPGVMSSSPIFLPDYRVFTLDMLVKNLYRDFKYLGIEHRIINPDDKISEDEWKIALFVTLAYFNSKEKIDDYHFLRQREDGTWYHKNGFEGIVSNRDRLFKEIIDPSDCKLNDRDYVRTLALKLH